MKKWLLLILCLFIPAIAFAAGSVNGVEAPAAVNSVDEPDTVCGVSGLSGGSGSSENDPFFADGSTQLLQSSGSTVTVRFVGGSVYIAHEN